MLYDDTDQGPAPSCRPTDRLPWQILVGPKACEGKLEPTARRRIARNLSREVLGADS